MSKELDFSKTLKTKKIFRLKQERSFLNEKIIDLKEKTISFKSIQEIPLFKSCVVASINKSDCFN